MITLTSGQLTVSNSLVILGPGPAMLTLSGNHASRVFNVTGTDVTISGLTIANGQSALNGAGINVAGSAGSVVAVNNCILTNNTTSSGGGGGGIYNSPGVTITVSNCALSGNSATFGLGGGVYNDHGTLTIFDSTLNSNSADYGGGLYNDGAWSGSATLTLAASTFSGNSASAGGGMLNDGAWSGSANVRLAASTFSGNSSGICIDGRFAGSALLEIGDTILSALPSGGNIANYDGAIISDGYNLGSDDAGGWLTNATDQVNADPKLGPLQNNGGPTWTHALLRGSPAIDKGNANAVPTLALNTDQRGFPRPVDNPSIANATGGDGSDIGAFEEQYSAFVLRVGSVAGYPNQKNLTFTPWASGRTYTVECTTNLTGTVFAPLTGYGGPMTNGTEVIITDLNATGPQKFYRLQTTLP